MTDKEPTRSVQRRIASQKGLPAPDFSLRDQIEELSLEICQYLIPQAYQKDTPPKIRAEDIATHLLKLGYRKIDDPEIVEACSAGMMKVVEWIRHHPHILHSYHVEDWKRFLKSEGIE